MNELLRLWGPVVLALLATLGFDLATRRRGFDPPGFVQPLRRATGLAGIAMAFWLAFSPLGTLGEGKTLDLGAVSSWQLFQVHGFLLLAVVLWFAAGQLGYDTPGATPAARAARELGLSGRGLGREIGIGLAFGVGAWFAVLVVVVLVGLAVVALGGEGALPQTPPEVIHWLAGKPAGLRLALALSAGVFEELFFRGLLQPRVGIAASTAVFALAHAGYEQIFLLLGVSLLSIAYGWLVKFRQSIVAAMVAHAVFDGVQLLVVIPAVLKLFGSG